jgi:HK97 family phage prohead protease
VDSVGDIIHKGAFARTVVDRGRQIKFLWQHNTDEPIGKIVEMREDDKGLFFRAQVSDTQRGRDALTLVKDGALDSMSIGYDAVVKDNSHLNGSTVRNLREIRLWEISMVTFPANEQALITGVKQEDDPAPTEGKPYAAVHEGDVWRVYKLDEAGKPTGDALGEHATEDEANAQVEALYANEPDADKATWTAAQINDLPDESFLYIDAEAATGKDDGGLTVPRSARYFPYKDVDGVVDLPHLRNALARIPQSNLSAEIQERLTGMAQAILEKETAAEGKDAIFVNAIIALSDAHKARKAGRVLASRNADKIRAALDALTQVLIDAGVDLGTETTPQEETPPAQDWARDKLSSNAQHDSKGAGPASPPTHDRARLLRLVEFEIAVQKIMGG